MEIVKTVSKKKDSKGVERNFINFYVRLENGNLISISPKQFVLKDGTEFSSFRELNTIAVLLPNKDK